MLKRWNFLETGFYEGINVLLFDRPEHLQATVPPETRATPRDGVRLLVTTPDGNAHARFSDLHEFLEAGDLPVVNESATLAASLPAKGYVGGFVLNLSTDYGDGLWLTEPRWSSSKPGPLPLNEGELIWMPGLIGRLVSKYPGLERLWFVQIHGDVQAALAEDGSPIRYGYVDQDYPLEAYQTVFGRVPGTAEMPSAGRPFSQDVIDSLNEKGVPIARLVLHTGVSSLEVDSEELEDQVMYPEPYAVPPATAKAVNDAKRQGRRVIAVGTTVVRALESAWDGRRVRPRSGFTRLYIHPGGGVYVVDGLLTGFHDPMASHLAMLYALAGEEMVRAAYTEAVQHGYLWHEFGSRPVKWCKSASSCCCCLGGCRLREIGLRKSFVEGQNGGCEVSTSDDPFVVLLSQDGANEAAHGRPVRRRCPPHRCVAGSPC